MSVDYTSNDIDVEVAGEREKCAKIAERVIECYLEHPDDCRCTGKDRIVLQDIADLIRARGK